MTDTYVCNKCGAVVLITVDDRGHGPVALRVECPRCPYFMGRVKERPEPQRTCVLCASNAPHTMCQYSVDTAGPEPQRTSEGEPAQPDAPVRCHGSRAVTHPDCDCDDTSHCQIDCPGCVDCRPTPDAPGCACTCNSPIDGMHNRGCPLGPPRAAGCAHLYADGSMCTERRESWHHDEGRTDIGCHIYVPPRAEGCERCGGTKRVPLSLLSRARLAGGREVTASLFGIRVTSLPFVPPCGSCGQAVYLVGRTHTTPMESRLQVCCVACGWLKTVDFTAKPHPAPGDGE